MPEEYFGYDLYAPSNELVDTLIDRQNKNPSPLSVWRDFNERGSLFEGLVIIDLTEKVENRKKVGWKVFKVRVSPVCEI